MTIWIDGALHGGDQVPRASGVAPFETMAARAAQLPLWERHLTRLAAAARRLGLAFAPTPALRAAAAEVLLKNGHGDDVLRLSLVPGDGGVVHTALTSRARSPLTALKLLPTVALRPPEGGPEGAPPADLKAEPRRFYDLVRQQAQDGEADDGILVDRDGAVLEAALGNLWFRIDGQWVTPALDGRVLPGICRAVLLERGPAAGLTMRERACTLADLHRAEAIAHGNAACGPRPAALVGEAPARELVQSELVPLWQAALASGGGSGGR